MDFNLNIHTSLDIVSDHIEALLWTILFQRLFGTISPSQSTFLGITYPKVELPILQTLIDSKISQFKRDIMESKTLSQNDHDDDNDNQSLEDETELGSFRLSFFEKFSKRDSKNTLLKFWTNETKESSEDITGIVNDDIQRGSFQDCWETWNLTLYISSGKDYANSFLESMFQILDITDINKSHIPTIRSVAIAPFPFKIAYLVKKDSSIGSSMEYITEKDAQEE
ncbi:hypothetical protein PP7435_CHR3-0707 [Komagataella phaffii CBS 7435]|uniref:Autophagy-related protein 101 n=2 Tax=Komagataella phaffii TaxID=460519 RepID=C4R4R3_KOMPG|nr:Hypothetical protein PAS_chr3_0501 [Komagataella phaffii GS115]AOA64045.1 GQ67_03573T0 [Komagataella phaffii]CAH2449690.1 hypothetical protein BQ9382_C3-3745 [Komagataella phaffii CBS 7435]AOA69183.1 GQ68_03543T0 [Komagataella phaffii GS115]CAY70549.1 Hypothetical protein PAS_chr3_0501 [Komagataella phaffii GS115]CCA39663.1 hypothetical protein PP7435_CHR3-0707 [Komagataella phaffii CBS 7435]